MNTKINLIDKIVNKLFGNSLQIRYLNQFYKGLSKPINSKRNVLIYSGIGHMYCTPFEVLIYHLLGDRGFNVDYCIYDKNIPINEVITQASETKVGKKKFWNKSVENAQRFLDNSKVNYEFIKYDDEVEKILNKNKFSIETILKFEYEGIKFGEIVNKVLFRYYRSKRLENDSLSTAKRFMYTALTNYFYFKKKLSHKDYEYILFSHGIYCTWAPILEHCKKIDQPFICYDRGKTKSSLTINLNKPSTVWDISDVWIRLKNYNLNNKEKKMVDEYLSERELQKGDVYSYNLKQKAKDLNVLRKALNIKPNSKVITIFTNLIWDAANVRGQIAFRDTFDCIVKSIDKYNSVDGVHILIRPHPAEYVVGTNEGYEEMLLKRYDNNLPRNVTVISNEMLVNSFSVIELTDIGVINTSTIGIEMSIEGKPTILISEPHYRSKGFTYDASSENHYFQLIDGILKNGHQLPNQIRLAKKYFYLMMFEYQHTMPFKFSSFNTFDGYNYKSFNDLKYDKNEKINLIVERISSGNFSDFIFK